MVKRALTLITSILIALHLLMPFNIYADTIDLTNVIGVNTELIDSTFIETVTINNYPYQRMAFNYESTIELDANYVGYLNIGFTANYYLQLTSGLSTGSVSYPNKKIFVNGDKVKFSWSIVSTYTGTDPFIRSSYVNNPNISIVDSGLTKIEDLDSIDQIINILLDLYNSNDQVEGLLYDQLTQLQLVVSNTSSANQYLDTITKLRQWHIPIESYPIIEKLLSDNKEVVNINSINYYNYPVFKFTSGENIINYYLNNTDQKSLLFLCYVKSGHHNNIFVSPNNVSITYSSIGGNISNGFVLMKYFITNLSDSGISLNLNANFDILELIPIYIYRGNSDKDILNISTDFALQFGLNNRLLDNLNIIVNGTAQSSSAVQSSDRANSELQTDSNTLFEQENDFKSDMQSAMQNVNNTFRLQDMGTKFVSSAQWVRTQYEQLTNNTPFASLITFSLITGLALILLGKVYK